MSSAAFAPGPSTHRNRNGNPNRRADGATVHSAHSLHSLHSAHRIGRAVRAVKVFVGAAFSVAVLGEYAQEAGVKRR
ncbi:hypothetical protein [Streptomyces sp. ISL-99]|uniref:hypothetical protein n=1 Tax=Streptomyces sp. ISL-99 TaxID=2819193 RepID=UPI002035A806|nr:hypothetical protein [Streptomyces sp. ISL-99]